jgi:hypothetical protein
MSPVALGLLETGGAALLFAAIFLFGGRVHPLRPWVSDRSIISFSAGMAAAYVFIHLMPEMHAARQAFTESASESTSIVLRFEGKAIYFLALVGFMAFYGLEHLRARVSEATELDQTGLAFRIQIGGFAAYVWVMSYLLVNSLEGVTLSPLWYAVAITFHLLTIEHDLREEYGDAYRRVGRWVLAGMCLFGWGVGQLMPLPPYALALLVAFVSGAVIMNSAVTELPSEKNGRFLPFLLGGLVYGLILLPLR